MNPTAPRLLIDSADRAQAEALLGTGAFVGLTTNPTILERGGCRAADLPAVHAWARAAGAEEICFQTWGTTADELLANASRLLEIDPGLVVKVPTTAPGIRAAARLVDQGVEVLLTAVYRPAQMLAACAIGVRYVAPYVGRMADTGTADAVGATVAMQQIADRAGTSTLVLAASLRTVEEVIALAVGGVRAFTLSPPVAWEVLTDERSQAATDVFEDTMGRLG